MGGHGGYADNASDAQDAIDGPDRWEHQCHDQCVNKDAELRNLQHHTVEDGDASDMVSITVSGEAS